jgi:hypothetical protein
MPGFIAPSGASYEDALNQARAIYGDNLNQSFVWNNQEFSAGTGQSWNPALPAGNNKMPMSVDKAKGFPLGKAKKYPSNNSPSIASPATSKISRDEINALENNPSSLRKKVGTMNAKKVGSPSPQNMQGNVRIYDDGRVEQLGGIAQESMSVSRPGKEAIVDVSNETHLTVPRGAAQVAPDFADMLSNEDVSDMPDFMDTASLGGGQSAPIEAKGFLSDDDLMSTIQPQKLGELPPAMKAMKTRDISSTMPDVSAKMVDVPSVSDLPGVPSLGDKAKGLMGKANDFMAGSGGTAIKGIAQIASHIGQQQARESAIGDIQGAISNLNTEMEQATIGRIEGFDEAQAEFDQSRTILGKRAGDRYVDATKSVKHSNIGTGSRKAAIRDARSSIETGVEASLGDMTNRLGKKRGRVLADSRVRRDKARSAKVEQERLLKDLEKQQKLGPIKTAGAVAGAINPAFGMAFNAGMSLYEAYG